MFKFNLEFIVEDIKSIVLTAFFLEDLYKISYQGYFDTTIILWVEVFASKYHNRIKMRSITKQSQTNLDDDETLLLLTEILEDVEEFFLSDFFADIF